MNRKTKRIFVDDRGLLRIGWRLALGIGVYAAVLYGVIGILSLIFGKLFEAWGVTNANLVYAPRWAQWIVAAHADAIYLAAYAAALLGGMVLAKRWTAPRKNAAKVTARGALVGMVPGMALTAVVFLLDSMRLESALTEPAMGFAQGSALAVLLLGSLSGEMLTKRLVFDPVQHRFGRWSGYAAAVLTAVMLSVSRVYPVGLITAALMGIAGCAMYERGGLMASAAMAAGWSAWTGWLFAWPKNGSACVYRMYTVSDVWLTGGNAGAEAGFGAVVLWMIIAAILLRKEWKGCMNKRRSTNG